MNIINEVSFVIPVFNESLYLEKCLNSILNSVFKNNIIIISDNLSTDNSYSIAQSYEKSFKNIQLFSQKKMIHPHLNLTFAVSKVKTKWFCHIGGDDFLEFNFNNILQNTIPIPCIFRVEAFNDSNNKVLWTSPIEDDIIINKTNYIKSYLSSINQDTFIYGIHHRNTFLEVANSIKINSMEYELFWINIALKSYYFKENIIVEYYDKIILKKRYNKNSKFVNGYVNSVQILNRSSIKKNSIYDIFFKVILFVNRSFASIYNSFILYKKKYVNFNEFFLLNISNRRHDNLGFLFPSPVLVPIYIFYKKTLYKNISSVLLAYKKIK
jgi:glycosyltransferase involved in cell wall biosynthesis